MKWNRSIIWVHNYTIQDYNDGLLKGHAAVCESWRIGRIRFSCLIVGRVTLKGVLWGTKDNAQLSKESSEKAIDSFPRRYVIGMLASSTTPRALHGNTTSLYVHVTKV